MDKAGQGSSDSCFRIQLFELDQNESKSPVILQTVDELFQALLGRWDQEFAKKELVDS